MKDELEYIGKKIIENKSVLANNVSSLQKDLFVKSARQSYIDYESPDKQWQGNLFIYLGEYLQEQEEEIMDSIINWAKLVARASVELHIPLTLALRSLALYRTVIWDVFTEELRQKKFAPITMLDVGKIIDPVLDEISTIIGQVYEEHSDQLMKIAYTALEELSVPVVPITKDIAVIPIIGEIDTRRSQLLLDASLQESVRLGLEHLILDVSGVTIIDTMVADHLLKVIQSLNLIGVQSSLTGIRPEIAQTIVSLGVNLHSLDTHANLHVALASMGIKQVK